MAIYKDDNYLKKSQDAAFDTLHNAGASAPFAGIYRCTGCGHEIGIAQGHTLPPQPHGSAPAHTVTWQLMVYAEHKK